jgi:hypothetical protein
MPDVKKLFDIFREIFENRMGVGRLLCCLCPSLKAPIFSIKGVRTFDLLQLLRQKKTAKARRTQRIYDLFFSEPVHDTFDSLPSLLDRSILFTSRSLRPSRSVFQRMSR